MKNILSFNRKYNLSVISAFILLGALIYSNTFNSSFHFDDTSSIVENFSIRNVFNLHAIWSFWPTRFLTNLSLAVNYYFGRLNVFGYHLFNLLVHICASVMVWWFILLTFSTPAMRGKGIAKHAQLLACFGALVFIAHPVQTEAVTYIVQRAASLMTLFYLASLNLYIKSRLLRQVGSRPALSEVLFYGSLTAAIMAMFTKEIAITLPLMILLYEYCFLRTGEKPHRKQTLLLSATALIIPLTMFFTRSVNFMGMHRATESALAFSPWRYLLTESRVMITYIRLLFIPICQNLDYDYHVARGLFELPIVASIIFLVSMLTLAIKAFSKYRLISFGIFWFFLTLLPESSIIPIGDVIFEHRLYLPMVGFSLFMVSGICYIFKNKPMKAMVITLLIITSCYAVLSYRRNFIWKDDITLWNDAVHKSPGKARSYSNRGIAYYNKGDLSQALSNLNKAIEIDPGYVDAYNNRGSVYVKQGNLSQSIFEYTKAISIDPGYSKAYYNRGIVVGKQGNLPQAMLDFNKAIEINPGYVEAYYGRGVVYYMAKEYVKARADVRKAEDLGYVADPDFLNALKKASSGDR